ncbi:MAG TPA: serine dehydratase subunit alpha family protein [Candidatus Caccomonas pullistercoris]|nr:serine dehydratase subunit alpha family protein [Candidatus Caccomonas pullistercoris]
MINPEERRQIAGLVRRQVVPAIGCTEPICVALAVARATELLGTTPERIEVRLSANILKNAMGVGIPGTGMVGLPIAIALGALIGRSELELEVLRDVTPEAVEQGRHYVDEGRIDIALKAGIDEKLYAEARCLAAGHEATAVIAGEHTRFVRLEADGDVRLDATTHTGAAADTTDEPHLTLRKVYDYATTAPLDEISFILDARRLNEEAARRSLESNYGHCLGKTLTRPLGRGIMGDSIFSRILSSTACACDARMAGAMIPVMSNSGSGNQGICATNPVVVFAEENHNTEEEMVRALMLSHLTAIYIKQHLGTLSALCGCVVASTGSSCGITLLMGGGYREVTYAVKNMIANLTGMICDGAKPSCALKLTSGVSTAVLSAMLAMQGNCVSSVEGIIDDDVDRSIRNLTSIGADAMNETDRCVLDIMTHKSHPTA